MLPWVELSGGKQALPTSGLVKIIGKSVLFQVNLRNNRIIKTCELQDALWFL
jgi:hypothetical protein